MTKLLPIILVLAACGSSPPKDPVEKLEDPTTCMECHGKHYTQWSGSMHAYASDDPVFIAMNKRGQRETSGALGTFCVQCHAPMAVALAQQMGTTFDATHFDPTTLTPATRGITCYFCHNVESVKADHNNGLVLAMDQKMRGGAQNPVDSPAHDSTYDKAMASYTNNSTACGSCHDVVTPAGVALEKTYNEWQGTVFATNDPANLLPVTCSSCHMVSTPKDVIADKPGLNVPERAYGFHNHGFPAIDQALVDFPGTADQMTGITDILKPSIQIIGPRPAGGGPSPGGICVTPENGGQLTVRMDTISLGHKFPSGVTHDRRVWLEVKAFNAAGAVVFSSGIVPDGMDPEEINDDAINCKSPTLCTGLWERTFKSDGTPAQFFWDVATTDEGAHLLKPPVTLDPTDPRFDHSTTAVFPISSVASQIDHITTRIRIRPLPYRTLDALVSSGDLDATIASKMKTLDAQGGTNTWSNAGAHMAPIFTGCCPAGQPSC